MRLTLHTDYALRVLMYLALRPGRLSTIQTIADAYGISKNHLMKVSQQLGRNGYVKTIRGRTGGLELAHEPEDINIGAVVRLMEEDFQIVECFTTGKSNCIITRSCGLSGILHTALDAWLAVLDQYTLADTIKKRADLRKLLGLGDGVPA